MLSWLPPRWRRARGVKDALLVASEVEKRNSEVLGASDDD